MYEVNAGFTQIREWRVALLSVSFAFENDPEAIPCGMLHSGFGTLSPDQ
jgi:hypothetical protein